MQFHKTRIRADGSWSSLELVQTELSRWYLIAHLIVKVTPPGGSIEPFSVFKSSCHLSLPVLTNQLQRQSSRERSNITGNFRPPPPIWRNYWRFQQTPPPYTENRARGTVNLTFFSHYKSYIIWPSTLTVWAPHPPEASYDFERSLKCLA